MSPFRGVIAGALTTAVIQSSSAMTVTAVGFVGAGLLTFPQGLEIVFGANIGTTITGWQVAILGFKFQLDLIVLPLVFVGVLLRLLSSTRWRHLGWAMAGFSFLFVGIDAMQQGMAPFEGIVTQDDFPEGTLFGRFRLVLLGIVIALGSSVLLDHERLAGPPGRWPEDVTTSHEAPDPSKDLTTTL